MMSIKENLKNSIKSAIDNLLLEEFDIDRSNIPVEFDKTILLFYKSFRQKMLPIRRWTVIKHPDVTIPADLNAGFNSLVKALETGSDDISRYMTTRIAKAGHVDLMLDCDEIYHFHLSDKDHPKNEKFNARTDKRAFVYFDYTKDKAYVIDIYRHGAEKNFIKDRLIKLWKQYPEACARNVQEGQLESDYSDGEHAKLRAHGINSLIQLDETHFFITSGVSADGITAIDDVFYHNRAMHLIDAYAKNIEANVASIFSTSNKIDVTFSCRNRYDVWIKITRNGTTEVEQKLFCIETPHLRQPAKK